MDSKMFPDMKMCKSMKEPDAVIYLNKVIDKLEQSLDSLNTVNIYDLILRLATSYFDYYDYFIDRICKEFIRRDLTNSIYHILNNLTAPLVVTNKTTETILELLMHFSDHSSEIADKIQTSKILDLIIDSVLNENLTDIKNEQTNKIVKMCIIIISNFSRDLKNRLIYRRDEIKHILIKFIKVNSSDSLGIVSVLTLSYLIDENDVGLLDEGLNGVTILIRQIGSTLKTKQKSGGFTLHELLRCLHCISFNDNMKKRLIDEKALPLLVKTLKERKGKEVGPTLGIIENLCFNDEIKRKMIEEYKIEEYKIEELVKPFIKNEQEDVKKHASGILWKIKNKWESTHQKLKGQKINFDVFLSYSWANKKEVLNIRNDFKKNNIRVWIDVEQMTGSPLEAVANGIETSQLVIIAISSSYSKSLNCRCEAEYAYKIRKKIIPVVMELRYKATSWLGFIIGTSMYYELSERTNIKEEIMKLRKHVKSNLKNNMTLTNEQNDQNHLYNNNGNQSFEKISDNYEAIEKWTTEDVQRWLETSNLGYLKEALIKVDGSLLQKLLEIRSNSSDYFNKTLQSEFGMKFVDVLAFHKILDQLSS